MIDCEIIIIYTILFYLLIKSFKKTKEHMTNVNDNTNINMEAIANLSSFVGNNDTQLQKLVDIVNKNELCLGNTCVNATDFANMKNTYTKAQTYTKQETDSKYIKNNRQVALWNDNAKCRTLGRLLLVLKLVDVIGDLELVIVDNMERYQQIINGI